MILRTVLNRAGTRVAREIRAWESRWATKILARPFQTLPGSQLRRNDGDGRERMFSTVLEGESLTWRIPAGYRIELHGHAFVLISRRSRRLAEVLIEADAPVRLDSHGGTAPLPSKTGEVRLDGPVGTATTVVVREARRVVDRGVGSGGSGWRIWDGQRRLTYHLEEPLTGQGKSTLCVAFSAIGAPYDFTYNYKSSLAEVDAYRLYILDNFGSQGSYYYADHRDAGVFEAVQSFLQEISSNLGILPAGMVFLGSSKGGTAALAHGLRLGAGRILAGAPQSLPGTYLSGAAPEMLKFIAGDSTPESVNWLDQMIPDAVGSTQGNPSITVLVGDNDSHKHVHVEPLVKMAAAAGLSIQTLVIKDLSHKDIGAAFGPYLEAVLQPGITSTGSFLPYRLARRDGADNMVQFKLWLPPGEVAAVEVRNAHSVVFTAGYSEDTYFLIDAPANEAVQATVRRRIGDAEAGSFTTGWLQPLR